MAEDHSLPKFLGKISPRFNTPNNAILLVGIINFILIATNSITYIASVSLISLAVCYMIGCLAYLGLKKKYPDLKRPYKAPMGVFGSWFTIVVYAFMLCFADRMALITAAIIGVASLAYFFLYTRGHKDVMPTLEEEIGEIDEPTATEKLHIDKEYKIWAWGTAIVTVVALAIYLVPILF